MQPIKPDIILEFAFEAKILEIHFFNFNFNSSFVDNSFNSSCSDNSAVCRLEGTSKQSRMDKKPHVFIVMFNELVKTCVDSIFCTCVNLVMTCANM
jgi:hypothetical protein